MTGSTKSVEIEDVLSSIRRLVSEHQAQRGALSQARSGNKVEEPAEAETTAPVTEKDAEPVGDAAPDTAEILTLTDPEPQGGAPDEATTDDATTDEATTDDAAPVEALLLTPALRVTAPDDPWSAVRPAADDAEADLNAEDWADAVWSGSGTPDADETDSAPQVEQIDDDELVSADATMADLVAEMSRDDDVPASAAADDVDDAEISDLSAEHEAPDELDQTHEEPATEASAEEAANADDTPEDQAVEGRAAGADLGHVLHLVNTEGATEDQDEVRNEDAEAAPQQAVAPTMPDTGDYEPVAETQDWDRDGAGTVVASLAAVRTAAQRRGNLAGVMAAERAHAEAGEPSDEALSDHQESGEGDQTAPKDVTDQGDQQAGSTGEAGDDDMAEDMTLRVEGDADEVEDLGNDYLDFSDQQDDDDEDDAAVMDEDALREMIAEVVRQELQGALGERITRNVRKLVRREIRTLLAAEHFE